MMAESSFILEYIFSIYAFCLVIYISFLSKKEYSLPIFSSSTNNYSQIILIFTPISLIFLDNVAYVSLSCCFLKDYFSTFFQVLVLFCSLLTIIASKKYLSLRLINLVESLNSFPSVSRANAVESSFTLDAGINGE